MSKFIVEGRWDCPQCGARGNRGSARECPHCGRPRGEDVEFYLGDGDAEEERALGPGAETRPDWVCAYCGALSPASVDTCVSCGAPRGRDFTPWARRAGSPTPRPVSSGAPRRSSSGGSPPATGCGRPRWVVPAALAALLAVVAVAVYLLVPRQVDLEVEGIHWRRTVAVERLTTVTESGWDVPADGRVVGQHTAVHHHDRVLDHYEDFYETVSERVVDHYKTVTHKRDLGNGNFEVEKTKEPVYRTVERRVRKQRPVYRDVPIYRTRYDYELERWRPARVEVAEGDDADPHPPVYTLADGQPPHNAGQERAGREDERLTVTGTAAGEHRELVVEDRAWWASMQPGTTVHGVVGSDDVLRCE